MNRFWEKLKQLLRAGVSLVAAVALVVRAPALAIGVMGVKASRRVRDDYLKVFVMAAASVLAAFMILNVGELAVAWTALGLLDALDLWSMYVETA